MVARVHFDFPVEKDLFCREHFHDLTKLAPVM